MSQVLTAEAVSTANSQAQGTLAAARKNDCFAAVFDQARKTSRQECRTNERLDALERLQARQRSAQSDDSDEPAATDGEAHSRSRELRDKKPGRAERLRESADKARMKDSAEAGADANVVETPQDADTRPIESERSTGQDGRGAEQEAHEESNDHEFQPQQYADPAVVAQTSASFNAAAGPATGSASGSTGSAWVPPGNSGGLPDGAVPVPAAAGAPGGAGSSPGLIGDGVRVQIVATATQNSGAGSNGASAGDRARSAAAAEGQAKPSGGADFQAILGQAGRARQAGQLLKTATAPAESSADPARKPIEIDGAAGPGDLARVLRSKVGARHSNMMIQLDPPELGRVRVDVRMHDEAMTVRFEAQTQAGHDALQGRLRELTGALEQQGVRLDRVEVEYRPPQDAQQDTQSSLQQGGQQWQEPRSTGDGGPWQEHPQTPSFEGSSALEGLAAIAGVQAQVGILSASGVDLVV